MDIKIILSDFPVVGGVLRVTESARKNVGGAPIANVEYLWSEILMCGGNPRTNACMICRLSRETKQYPIRKELTEDGSITNTGNLNNCLATAFSIIF